MADKAGDALTRLTAGCRQRRWGLVWWGEWNGRWATVRCRVEGAGFPAPAAVVSAVMRDSSTFDFAAAVDAVADMVLSAINDGGRR